MYSVCVCVCVSVCSFTSVCRNFVLYVQCVCVSVCARLLLYAKTLYM